MKRLGPLTFFSRKKTACETQKKEYVLVSDTQIKMGTVVNLQCLSESSILAEECMARAFLRIDELEAVFSRHNASSLLSVLNSQGALQDFPREFKIVLETSLVVEHLTHGAFNPSVLSVLEYLEQHKHINTKELQEHFSRIIHVPFSVDEKKILLKHRDSIVTLDAIAKGFIVDCAADLFEQNGIQNYLINAGGDIRVKGMKSLEKGNEKSWRLAVEDPYKNGNYPAVFSLMRGALATSGNYEKNFGNNRHHIILPSANSYNEAEDAEHLYAKVSDMNSKKRLFSLSGDAEHTSPTVKSVSVIAPNAMLADAFATAVSCMPLKTALDFIGKRTELACMIIAEDDSIHTSKNWMIR